MCNGACDGGFVCCVKRHVCAYIAHVRCATFGERDLSVLSRSIPGFCIALLPPPCA